MAMRSPTTPGTISPTSASSRRRGSWGRGRAAGSTPPWRGCSCWAGGKPLREVFPHFRLEYREEDTGFSLATARPGPPENLFSFYTLVSRRLAAVSALLAQSPGEEAALAEAMREAVLTPSSTPTTSAGAG